MAADNTKPSICPRCLQRVTMRLVNDEWIAFEATGERHECQNT
jgi:hypothetical protein